MNEKQRKARKLSAENGNIRWIKDNCLRTKDDNEDYVFISYKSDDFERVLDDIVFKACKKYGLKVYFDTAFDEKADLWITQYAENICSSHCKAFIAFIDDAYCSSYACLLEMMTRKQLGAGGNYFIPDSLFFLPINIGAVEYVSDDSNTGLGTKRFSNGVENDHAEEELKRFNQVFKAVANDIMKNIYIPEDTGLYWEKTEQDREHGKVNLKVGQCKALMKEVTPKANDNDGGNKDFVDVIYDKLMKEHIDTVFGKAADVTQKKDKGIGESRKKSVVKLKDFFETYNNNNFKKGTFTTFRLVGKGSNRRFTTEFYDSAYDLAWAFIMSLLAEKGPSYMKEVNKVHADMKNPIFIKKDVYHKMEDQSKYRQVSVAGLENYYMYRHYGQYDWIGTALKNRLLEYGLQVDDFSFEYYGGDSSEG